MLSTALIDRILQRLPSACVGVLGDLFLDRYLTIDDTLTEPSIETGLDAYQVVAVRAQPGAAGTIINNLAALGVGRIVPLAIVGDDGEGYELGQALAALRVVAAEGVCAWPGRRTPTYTKPMLHARGRSPRELNRLDIKNRSPLPAEAERRLLERLADLWPELDALVVLDQVSEPDCGVVTARVRARLAEMADADPAKFVLADSRAQVGFFRSVALKPNRSECLDAVPGPPEESDALAAAARRLADQAGRPVFCTRGEEGIWLARPGQAAGVVVPAYPVLGPVDIVGAGDSTSAGIVCAKLAGATEEEAAAFGNLIASITVRQLGTTGTATPAQVWDRWREIVGPGA